MSESVQTVVSGDLNTNGLRWRLSRAMLVLALVVIGGSFLLISPPTGQTYPGAIPWRDTSVLKPIIELMSVFGAVSTPRGVEIKDFVLHCGAVAGLLLLALRIAIGPPLLARATPPGWCVAPLLLGGFVLMALASGIWSSDPPSAFGQAALYGLMFAWALAVAGVIEPRDVPFLLRGIVALTVVTAILCIWYYFERNPFHRPGFPIGNPGPLTAAMLPAILVCGASVLTRVMHRSGSGDGSRVTAPLPWPLAIAALIPLGMCFWLAGGRAGLVGLTAGVTLALFILFGRRARAAVVGIGAVLLAAGGFYFYHAAYDVTMARGATIRFRAYVWRYAADLWMQRPLAGQGAGAFPRLAGQLATYDRALDPGAFMGSIAEHAHNEFFETLVETGGIGGILWVGGFLATFACAARAVKREPTLGGKIVRLAMPAALAALLTDALLGASMRLPGVPAIFFALLGLNWAMARHSAAPERKVADAKPIERRNLNRQLAAGACVLAAAVTGFLSVQNIDAVRREQRAAAAMNRGEFASAAEEARTAEGALLDPVRRLLAAELQVRADLGIAGVQLQEFAALMQRVHVTTSQPATLPGLAQPFNDLIDIYEQTFEAAHALDHRAPRLLRMAVYGARAAEQLAQLWTLRDVQKSAHWALIAEQAWRAHRSWAPYDVETLLALTKYPETTAYKLGLLRDALRFADTNDSQWLEGLRSVAGAPDAPAIIDQWLANAGPLDQSTGVDTLVASMGPEVYRLAAAFEAQIRTRSGGGADAKTHLLRAAELAQHAAELYKPMRSRFPTLESTALGEQANYLIMADEANAPRVVDLLQQALAALPVIQEQQFETIASPYRLALARALLLVARDEDAAEQMRRVVAARDVPDPKGLEWVLLAESVIRRPDVDLRRVQGWLLRATRENPASMRAWGWITWIDARRGDAATVRKHLDEATAGGLTAEDRGRIENSLAKEFPALKF